MSQSVSCRCYVNSSGSSEITPVSPSSAPPSPGCCLSQEAEAFPVNVCECRVYKTAEKLLHPRGQMQEEGLCAHAQVWLSRSTPLTRNLESHTGVRSGQGAASPVPEMVSLETVVSWCRRKQR